MENSKIIVFIVSLIVISCTQNEKHNSLGNNLYIKNDTLYLKNSEIDFENKKDSIFHYDFDGLYENQNLLLSKIIDTVSFKRAKGYYYDKSNIYYYNEKPLYFPTLNIIPSYSKVLKMYYGDYVATDNKIFFRSIEIKDCDINSFGVSCISKDGYYIAFDKKNFFYKDSIVSNEEFIRIIRKVN